MKKFVTALCTVATLCVIATSAFAANQVRISQVYSGGGVSGAATYTKDYVELFNFGGTPVNIGGWVLEYGSATGFWGNGSGNQFTFPVGTTIQPCSYILVALGALGTGGATIPVTPDFTSTSISMSATDGKIGLFNILQNGVACGAEAIGSIVDKVSYGTGNCPEGVNVGALSNTNGAVRKINGNQDTDNNLADFNVVANPVPRNSASPRNPVCVDSFGACCLRNTTTGACAMVVSSQACDLLNGIFLGFGTSCTPTPCATPTEKHTWGQVKSIYR